MVKPENLREWKYVINKVIEKGKIKDYEGVILFYAMRMGYPANRQEVYNIVEREGIIPSWDLARVFLHVETEYFKDKSMQANIHRMQEDGRRAGTAVRQDIKRIVKKQISPTLQKIAKKTPRKESEFDELDRLLEELEGIP